MRKQLFVLLFTISLLVPGAAFGQQAVKLTTAERQMAEGITAAQLKDYLYFVASDAMEGRDTPSRGLDATAEFLKMMLSRWGFKPAGDNGTFFQKIALTREGIDSSQTTMEIGGQSYTFGEDFYRVRGSGTASGPIVFGKDGWFVKAKGIDAYSGVDVKGKVVVLSSPNFSQQTVIGRPAGVTQDDLKGAKGVDWADPITYATQKGATAVIVVAPPQLQAMWSNLRGFLGRGSMYPDKLRETPTDTTPAIPSFIVTEKVGNAIFAGESGDKTAAAAFETKKSVRLAATTKTENLSTQNVV